MKLFRKIAMAITVLAATSGLTSCNYNSLVEKQQGVEEAWAQVENQYQRRADLIPNLVNTVKGYSTHEEETLTKVVEARAKATSITLDAKDLTEENLARRPARHPQPAGRAQEPSAFPQGRHRPPGGSLI